MFNGKYTSVYEIIASAYRDFGIDEVIISDAIEWAGEVIELLNPPYELIEKVKVVLVDCGKAEIPCDLHSFNGIKGHVDKDASLIDECEFSINNFIPMIYSTDIYHTYDNSSSNCNNNQATYKLVDNHIIPNFDDGFLAISYKAIPVDDDGFPLIPDNIKFKNAVKYHIMWKLAFMKLVQGKISGQAYQIIERDRDWYIGAASNESQKPSMDQMESIKNNWIRMIPKINQHRDGFKSANQQENRIIHNAGNFNKTGYNNNTYFYSK